MKIYINKKGYTLLEVIIVIALFWIFATAVMGFQSYLFSQDNRTQAYELLSRNQSITNQVINKYLKEIDKILFVYSPSYWWTEFIYPKSIDWLTGDWQTFYNGRYWSYLDFSTDTEDDDWTNKCKRFDIKNYDLIWFTIKGDLHPIVIWVQTKRIFINWTETSVKSFAMYKFPDIESATKHGIEFIDPVTNRINTNISFGAKKDSDCEQYTTWFFSEFLKDKDNYLHPNVKIPKYWFKITIPSWLQEHPTVWFLTVDLTQQILYSSPRRTNMLYNSSYTYSFWGEY